MVDVSSYKCVILAIPPFFSKLNDCPWYVVNSPDNSWYRVATWIKNGVA
ncbi:hypothetical protein Q2T41_14740 [Maribacter confluentis]|uniref:Uncharacterized protein n=1 Tax=Maribacter confluentis TaxID=1656093 RepID=A0ABT8RV05_9FLAO|nr:hypothetical protein [Maribacter confluentis]MDO1513916.1 hypothetical protein [Maribacter confluentis]